jgi:uncharacterized membrane protein (UPF0127 family)
MILIWKQVSLLPKTKNMKIITFTLVFFVIICAISIYITHLPPTIRLLFKGNSLICEIADTPKKREAGLMYRESLSADSGMLFVYPNEELRTFHMPNVKMPLSIVFANSEGIIVSMTEMIMDETTLYPSEKPAKYAVEANKGWFTKHHVSIGDKIDGLSALQR